MSLTAETCEEFWNIADKGGDGELTVQELTSALRSYNPNYSDDDCAAIFCDIDKSGDKKISKQEFIKEMREKPSRADKVKKLFKEYDTSGDGKLSESEVPKLIASCFKPEVVDQVVEQLLKNCDKDSDGKISFNEFEKFFN